MTLAPFLAWAKLAATLCVGGRSDTIIPSSASCFSVHSLSLHCPWGKRNWVANCRTLSPQPERYENPVDLLHHSSRARGGNAIDSSNTTEMPANCSCKTRLGKRRGFDPPGLRLRGGRG
ncbi:hypothetical protein PF010_g26289 [Phytophthora fragariae]|uniref:Secreted protein n=1 Tax=Phytophthora fragariae TaxID=53985 RepID=A0A6G0JXD5_9STRA|nr:hypothetical protein PF010_g26289 [Phytophthora fragariae]